MYTQGIEGQVVLRTPIGEGGDPHHLSFTFLWRRACLIYILPLVLTIVHLSAPGKGSTNNPARLGVSTHGVFC